jgi:hypothetical protein
MKPLFLLLPFSFLLLPSLAAQDVQRLTPEPAIKAFLDFADDKTLDLASNREGEFALVALPPDETVAVAAALPPSLAGKTLTAEPFDGGTVTVGKDESLTVSDKGLVTFSFNAGTNPGTYRLILRNGEDDHWQFSFSVPNPADATANPAAVQAQPAAQAD